MKKEHIELRAKKVAVFSRSDQSQCSVAVGSFSTSAPQRLSGKEKIETQRREDTKKSQFSVAATCHLEGGTACPDGSGTERSATTELHSNSKNLPGTGHFPLGSGKNASGRVNSSWGAEKLRRGGSIPVVELKNRVVEGQFPLGSGKITLWRVNSRCGAEKLRRGGSILVGEWKNCVGEGQFSSGRVNSCCGGSIPVVEGQSTPGINKTGHSRKTATSFSTFVSLCACIVNFVVKKKERKLTTENHREITENTEYSWLAARGSQLATRSLKHPSPDGIGISPKGRVRSELKLLSRGSQLITRSFKEENSTVKQHSKNPQRRDFIYNASTPVCPNAGYEAGELAIRACELLLINN